MWSNSWELKKIRSYESEIKSLRCKPYNDENLKKIKELEKSIRLAKISLNGGGA